MTDSDARNRGPGRPPIGSTPITVRLPPHELDALDTWIALNAPGVSRPEAMRRMLSLATTGTIRATQRTYGPVELDRSREVVRFWIDDRGERFTAEVTFEALDRINTERPEKMILEEPRHFLDLADRWQPYLVDAAIAQHRSVNTVQVGERDVDNVISY